MHNEPIDYLRSDCGRVHAINSRPEGATLEIGILCAFSFDETTIRISNDQHSFDIEVPKDLRSKGDRVKAFNVPAAILNYEPV